MTRFEKIQSMSIEEMDHMICEYMAETVGCHDCVASGKCKFGHNGMREYLEEEIDEN